MLGILRCFSLFFTSLKVDFRMRGCFFCCFLVGLHRQQRQRQQQLWPRAALTYVWSVSRWGHQGHLLPDTGNGLRPIYLFIFGGRGRGGSASIFHGNFPRNRFSWPVWVRGGEEESRPGAQRAAWLRSQLHLYLLSPLFPKARAENPPPPKNGKGGWTGVVHVSPKPIKLNVMSADAFLKGHPWLGTPHCLPHKTNLIFFSL